MTDRNCVVETYRFFAVNEEAGVMWDCSIDCLDDEDARATGTTLTSADLSIEVWDVARLVGRCVHAQ
jgi:hypothetical protein